MCIKECGVLAGELQVARNHGRCLSLGIPFCQSLQLTYVNYEQYDGPSLRSAETWAGRKTSVKYMYHGTHEKVNQLLPHFGFVHHLIFARVALHIAFPAAHCHGLPTPATGTRFWPPHRKGPRKRDIWLGEATIDAAQC
jgi:hypothetical protein